MTHVDSAWFIWIWHWVLLHNQSSPHHNITRGVSHLNWLIFLLWFIFFTRICVVSNSGMSGHLKCDGSALSAIYQFKNVYYVSINPPHQQPLSSLVCFQWFQSTFRFLLNLYSADQSYLPRLNREDDNWTPPLCHQDIVLFWCQQDQDLERWGQ